MASNTITLLILVVFRTWLKITAQKCSDSMDLAISMCSGPDIKGLSTEASCELPNSNGDKPQHYIAGQWCNIGKDCVAALKALLDNGANPNALDSKGRTCLHIMAESFSEPGKCAPGQDFIESGASLLVQNNADTSLKYKGKTAWEIAENKGASGKTQAAFGRPGAPSGGGSTGSSGGGSTASSGGGGGSADSSGDDGGDVTPIIIGAVAAVLVLVAIAAIYLRKKRSTPDKSASYTPAADKPAAAAPGATPAVQTGVIVGGPAAAKPAPMIIMAPGGS